MIILNSDSAVKAFHQGNVTLGGNLSVAAGPIGRNAEASGAVTIAAMYSYSRTKGLFAGVSLEGTVILERKDANYRMYSKYTTHDRVSAAEILTGKIEQPAEARLLYDALKIKLYRAQSIASSSSSVAPAVARAAVKRTSAVAPANPFGENRKIQRARALYDYQPSSESTTPNELAFQEGDIIEITKAGDSNSWWEGKVNGKFGYLPGNYVQLM